MPFSTGRALIIGVGEYAHSSYLNLPNTITDAQALAAALHDPDTCAYLDSQVRLLTGAEATSSSILAALDELTRTSIGDTVLLFYSGHGHYAADGTYCLTTYNTQLVGVPGKRTVVASTAVSQVALIEKLRAIPAERVLLIFNACHSGALSPVLDGDAEPATGVPVPPDTTAALLATGAGRIIITACRSQQYAFVGNGPRTIFADALINSLRGQRPEIVDRGGYISAFDLYTAIYAAVGESVANSVPEDIRQRYGGMQQPELTVLRGVGPFAIALYRGAVSLGSFSPPSRPASSAAVREISTEESQRAFQRILRVGQGVAIAGSVASATIAGRDQSIVNTGGGAYVEGIQQSVSISGGMINAPIIGGVSGGRIIFDGRAQPVAPVSSLSLAEVRMRIEAILVQATHQRNADLQDGLESVALMLRQAQRAEDDRSHERRHEKINQAAQLLEKLADSQIAAQELALLVRRLLASD